MKRELSNTTIQALHKTANDIRKTIIRMAAFSRTGHIGSAFSIVEILTAIYFYAMKQGAKYDGDRFVLSKGHGALAYYATLYHKGLISLDSVDAYLKNGSSMTAFPSQGFHPSLDFSSGSLGHGLSVASGMAYGKKLSQSNDRVFAICSDGECQEGSTWEAVQFAAQHRLSNLVVIVDGNKLQAIDKIENVLSQEGLLESWSALGWEVRRVAGHCPEQLISGIMQCSQEEKPLLVWADTVKGKGVSYMEDSIDWHYLGMNDEQIQVALDELEQNQ